MKKTYVLLAALALGAVSFTSCKKCKECDVKTEQFLNGQLVQEGTVSGQEYCGDELKEIEDNPEVTSTVSSPIGDVEQKITYTCN